jgi:hypothetical protein
VTTTQFAENAVHATLSGVGADPVTFWGAGHSLAVTNQDATQKLWFRYQPTNEVQTITLSSWDAGDTIKFTIDGTESAALTMVASSDHSDDIRRLLETLPTIGVGNVIVKQTSATVYVVWFKNGCAHKDMSPITCTNGTGSATGVVAETLKGGSTVAVASGADTYVVLPGQTKVLNVGVKRKLNISVVGSGNVYDVELL